MLPASDWPVPRGGIKDTSVHSSGVPNMLLASEDIKQKQNEIVQELCESRGGRPWLPVITSLLVSFGIGLSLSLICQPTSEDIKQHYLPTRFLCHVLKSAGQPHLLPRVYMLKSVLLFP